VLFPIRDSIAPRIAPVVNIGLIVVCCLAFVYQLTLGGEVERLLFAAAFIPARLFGSLPEVAGGIPDYGLAGNLATILLSMFLHGGWLHIIGNMWFLYVFGDNVESALGHIRYLLLYVGGGTAAALAHAVAETSSTVPTVGA
jgi:membrane associated rhomboid family serine protease